VIPARSLLLVLATACGAPPGASGHPVTERPAPPAATAVAAKDATGEAARSVASVAVPTPLDDALARVPRIMERLARTRGLGFRQAVPASAQTLPGFRQFLAVELARQLPADKARRQALAMAHLGLTRELIDLHVVLEDTLAAEVAAYYDARSQQFFVLDTADTDDELDMVVAHELTHALQDQHFDLQRYSGEAEDGTTRLNDDEALARRFVIEGEATLAMLQFVAESAGIDLTHPVMKVALIAQIKQLAEMRVIDAMSLAPGARGASASKAPLAILAPMFESYTRGMLPVLRLIAADGWKGVDELFTHPPTSTEQVLHPDTKLHPVREEPTAVLLPVPDNHELLYAGVMGEAMWRVYFLEWNIAGGDDAAAGWGGDRYWVARNPDGKLIGVHATTWDTPQDATEFARAYSASLSARFPGTKVNHKGLRRADGSRVILARSGKQVYIADGAGSDRALRALLAGASVAAAR
jgi:hypothetical protein